MDIFNSDTPSLVPETEQLGIGQIEKENLGSEGAVTEHPLAGTMALGLPEETTPYYIEEGQADWLLNGQNEGTENGHFLLGGSGYLDTDSGGDLLTGQTEEISQKEGGDLLTGGGLAIEKMVDEAESTVREMLQQGEPNTNTVTVNDTLDFSANGIEGWSFGNINSSDRWPEKPIFDSKEVFGAINSAGEIGIPLPGGLLPFPNPLTSPELKADYFIEDFSFQLDLYGQLGEFGKLDEFKYPLNIKVNKPKNAANGEDISIDFNSDSLGTGVVSGSGFEMPSINFDLIYDVGPFGFRNLRAESPLDLASFPLPNVESGGLSTPQTINVVRIDPISEFQVSFPLSQEVGLNANLAPPNNIAIQTDQPEQNSVEGSLPSLRGFGTSPFATLELDVDKALSNLPIPSAKALKLLSGGFSIPPTDDENAARSELDQAGEETESANTNRKNKLAELNASNKRVGEQEQLLEQRKKDREVSEFGANQTSKRRQEAEVQANLATLETQTAQQELEANPSSPEAQAKLQQAQQAQSEAENDLALRREVEVDFLKERNEAFDAEAQAEQELSRAKTENSQKQQELNQADRILEELGTQVENATEALKKAQEEGLQRSGVKLEYSLLDVKVGGGLVYRQDFTFEPEDVKVTVFVDGVQQEPKSLGEEFRLTTPNQGTGTLEVKTVFELLGQMNNEFGLAGEISGAISAMQAKLNAKLGVFSIPPFNFGPLVNLPGSLTSESFAKLSLDPVDLANIGGQEDATKNLIVEKTYYIPYGMPISISDASAEEGETLQFTVTLAEPSEEEVEVGYKSDKDSNTITFAPGQTTQTIEIPAGSVEATESFEVALINPNGISFPENLPNGESTITATGTIFNKPPTPDDNGPDGSKGSGHGDPHLVTFDGLYYDFQAAGEFVVAKSDGGDLEIQARQRPFVEQPLSVNTAVATKIGDQRIGFYAEEDSLIRIDGQPVEIPDNQSIPVGEGQISRDGRVYTVVYPSGEQLEVKTALTFRGVNYLNYNIFLNEDREGTISGILGNNNGNTDDDIILADGTVLEKPSREQLYGSYADSWRVTQESSLFDYEPGRSTDSFTINGFPTRDITVDDLDPADVARARELIGDRITDPALINATIIDLVFSDFDESFIESAEQVARTPEASIIIDIEPEAVTDTVTTASNTPTTINILANDISTPGLPVSLETFDGTSAAGGTITRDDSGTPDDASDDLLAYAPPANFSGSDSFQYTINDGERTATGLVTIIVPGLNLANLDGSDGFVLDGINPGNFSGVAVSKIGDFNGDSIDDLSIGAFAADPNGNNAAGESYVIFGTNNGFPANLDLTNLDGSNGLTLQGIDIQGLSGGAVGGAGDINNDGIDDLIIGAFGAPANGNNNAGKAYVVFGNSGLPANIDLANLNGSSGFVLSGLNEFDYAGVAVGGAGDINNDGIDDLYISAPGPLSSPPSKTYIVFGSETGYPANIDLSALNGSTGFVINDSRGLAGSDVSKAGDINNDGIADLIIGADEGSGDSYVVYGASNFPATVELSGILNGTNGSQLAATDVLNPDGTTVRGVGDVNNDGIDDLMVAVSGTTPVDNLPITKGYVVFGDRSLPFRFDLSALNGSNGFVINDFSIDNILGFSIGEVGDFNRDGIGDILIGTSQADANGNIDSGKSYVVFGKRDGNFPTNIDLARLDSRDGLVLNGAETEDLTGSAVDGAGDLNNDGISDLIVGAPGSLFNDAPGKSYVVFGSRNFGSSTTLVFDELYYLSQNPEVANLVASGALASGLEHFTRFGIGEDREFRVLLFNENSYLTQNPEVASLVASGELRSGLEHFTRFGQFEERSAGASEQSSIPLRFDENYYLNQNPDVSEAVEAGLFSSGFDHYIQVGQFQGRLTSA